MFSLPLVYKYFENVPCMKHSAWCWGWGAARGHLSPLCPLPVGLHPGASLSVYVGPAVGWLWAVALCCISVHYFLAILLLYIFLYIAVLYFHVVKSVVLFLDLFIFLKIWSLISSLSSLWILKLFSTLCCLGLPWLKIQSTVDFPHFLLTNQLALFTE